MSGFLSASDLYRCPRCNDSFNTKQGCQVHIQNTCWKNCDECVAAGRQRNCDTYHKDGGPCSRCAQQVPPLPCGHHEGVFEDHVPMKTGIAADGSLTLTRDPVLSKRGRAGEDGDVAERSPQKVRRIPRGRISGDPEPLIADSGPVAHGEGPVRLEPAVPAYPPLRPAVASGPVNDPPAPVLAPALEDLYRAPPVLPSTQHALVTTPSTAASREQVLARNLQDIPPFIPRRGQLGTIPHPSAPAAGPSERDPDRDSLFMPPPGLSRRLSGTTPDMRIPPPPYGQAQAAADPSASAASPAPRGPANFAQVFADLANLMIRQQQLEAENARIPQLEATIRRLQARIAELEGRGGADQRGGNSGAGSS